VNLAKVIHFSSFHTYPCKLFNDTQSNVYEMKAELFNYCVIMLKLLRGFISSRLISDDKTNLTWAIAANKRFVRDASAYGRDTAQS